MPGRVIYTQVPDKSSARKVETGLIKSMHRVSPSFATFAPARTCADVLAAIELCPSSGPREIHDYRKYNL